MTVRGRSRLGAISCAADCPGSTVKSMRLFRQVSRSSPEPSGLSRPDDARRMISVRWFGSGYARIGLPRLTEVVMTCGTFTALTCVAALTAAACAQSDSDRQQAATAQAGPTTVLYQDRVVELERTLDDPNDLWVPPRDLPRINDFVLKPEGACLAELCIPVRQDRDSEMFVIRAGQGWFNVTELARRLQQAFVVDAEHAV